MKYILSALFTFLFSTGVIVEASDIVFKDKSGNILTKEELANYSGTVDWEIHSDLNVSPKATEFHNLGRNYGQKGDTEHAIQSFLKAIELAPKWPYPYYDLAYTYLLNNNYEEAFKYYKMTDNLAPNGFFTTKTAVHYLEKELNGELPQGIYLYYLSFEWTNDPKKQFEIVENLSSKFPTFSPAWQKRANFENDPNKALGMIEKGLSSGPDLETRGFLLMNKAIALSNLGNRKEAIDILGQLIFNPKSPLDIRVLSKKTLSMLVYN